MKYYRVVRALYGLEAGSVERFDDRKAGALLLSGDIEPVEVSEPPAGVRPTTTEPRQPRGAARS